MHIGIQSVAFGVNTIASGTNSSAFGDQTIASGYCATAMGCTNSIASGSVSFAQGLQSTASGFNSIVMGTFAISSGDVSVAMGRNTSASGDRSFAMGNSTTASGSESVAMGRNTVASGDFSTSFGLRSIAAGLTSTAFGRDVNANAMSSIAFGVGVQGNPLVNNFINTLMVGFNSNISTLFIGSSSGIGSTGNVGIGDITGMFSGQPNNKLEINSNDASNFPGNSGLRLTDLTTASTPATNLFSPPAVLSVDANGDVILVRDSISTGGLNCWDLNSNGVCDIVTEDIDGNGGCDVADCQGADGATGPTGPQGPIGLTGPTGPAGADGINGTNGLNCWDLNNNGVCDLVTEDIDGNGGCDVADCQGAGADNDWDFTTNPPHMFSIPTGNVGIGTPAPTATLEILTPLTTTTLERLFRATINDAAGDFFELRNATFANGQFIPTLWGHHETNNRQALFLLGEITPAGDVGTSPVMTFDARRVAGEVQTRPLFSWESFGIARMTMLANGFLGIGTTNPVERLHVANNGRFDGNVILDGTALTTTTSNSRLTFDAALFGNPPTANNIFLGQDPTGAGGQALALIPANTPNFPANGMVFLGDLNINGFVQMRVGPLNDPNARRIKINENNNGKIELVNNNGDFISLDGNPGGAISTWGAPNGIALALNPNDGNVGIGTSTPATQLEINSGTLNTSGLTFTQLNNTVTPIPNSSNGVLSLDNSGQAIWVEDAGDDGDWAFVPPGNTINDPIFRFGSATIGSNTPAGLFRVSNTPLFTQQLQTAQFDMDATGVTTGINDIITSIKMDMTGLTNGNIRLLHLNMNNSNVSENIGALIQVNGNDNVVNRGLSVHVGGGGTSSTSTVGINVGAGATSGNATGLFAGGGGGNISIGVDAFAQSGITNIGIRAKANGLPANTRAGLFDGDVEIINGMLIPSDSSLKINVQDIDSALHIINQLHPVKFNYDTANYPMSFDGAQKYGLIAQEAEQALPAIVRNSAYPAQYDSLGNQISPSIQYKSTNYTLLIPILVQSIKEQQQIIEEQQNSTDSLSTLVNAQQQTIDSLTALVNSIPNNISLQNWQDSIENCLAQLPPGLACGSTQNKMSGNGAGGAGKDTDPGNVIDRYCITSVILIEPDNTVAVKETKLEQNVPNPFLTRTRFDYSIGEAGFVELLIHSYDGKFIAALVNETQQEGGYTAHWNTDEVAPGVYFYTLRVDGVDWVKKAIKIK